MASVSQIMEWKQQGHAEGLAEGMALGMAEARRSDLLKVLRMRFPDVPFEVTTGIRGTSDLDQLTRWFEAALIAPNIEMFRIMASSPNYRPN
jgi:hypothetical protein